MEDVHKNDLTVITSVYREIFPQNFNSCTLRFSVSFKVTSETWGASPKSTSNVKRNEAY